MKNKPYLIHIVATLIFLFLSFAYFIKPIAEGKKIQMGDISNYKGMSREIKNYAVETGETTLWTNSMFSGMPTYLINTPPSTKILTISHRILNLNNFRPVSFVFLYLIGFYIALLCFRVNPWLSIVGALAYAFSSYFFIIIEAGHAAKVTALGYLPAIIGGFHLAFHGKKILGSLIMTLFLALQLLVNHPQMTYYTLVIIAVYGVVLFWQSIKEKTIKDFFISSTVVAFGAILALACNLGVIMPTLEYSDYSIRGKSELSLDEKNQTSGLDIDYATDWSYGFAESFTLLIPNFMGGASGGELPENSETYKLYEKYQGRATAKKAIKQQPTYWGKVIFTSGPVYIGAIVFLLFIFALFTAEKKYIWWLVAATVISLIFAWGKHIPNITRFLFEYLPMYNKFRAVSSALVIAEFTMPFLAILAIDRLFKNKIPKEKAIEALKYSLAITGGLLLFFILFAGSLFSFESLNDEQYIAQGNGVLVDALQADRLMLLKKDAGRSLLFVLLAAGLVFVYLKDKLKLTYTIIGLGMLILIDMWGVNKRYLNNDNFVSKKENANPFTASAADKAILTDTELNYRVLNLAVSPFQDASTSYFHKSIGGYHGAKMRRYQDLIDFYISKEMQSIFASFQTQDLNKISEALRKNKVLNMLNTKYIIYNPQAAPILNYSAMGNAWFINNLNWVKDANEEIEALSTLNPKTEAIIDEKFKPVIGEFSPIADSSASINLTSYAPNKLIYKSKTEKEQLAVFSEIYYPEGWVATVDGKEVSHFRVNYILRAMRIPAGEHTIEFSFEPETYYKGQKIASLSSIILFLLIISTIGYQIYLKRKQVIKT